LTTDGSVPVVRDLRSLLSELAIERCALVGRPPAASSRSTCVADLPPVDAVAGLTNVTGYVADRPDDRFEAIEAVVPGDAERAIDAQLALWAPLDLEDS
jgi:hypothetical protein